MVHRTRILLDRADEYEKSGEWNAAVEVCEALFEESWRAGQLGDATEALLRLGLLYSARSERTLAEEYYELAHTIAIRHQDDARAARALNCLGVQHQRSGNLERAEEYYFAAQKRIAGDTDLRTDGDIEMNLGIVANIRGDLGQALHHYGRALERYEGIGNRQRIARILNNQGMLFIDLGELEKASHALEQALETCRQIGDLQVEGIVLANRTELLLARQELGAAKESCENGLQIADRLGDAQLRADLLKSCGVIYRDSGQAELAEIHLQQAIELAQELDYPLIEAEAFREVALIYRTENRNRDALAALNRSHRLFTTMQARQQQADIDKRLARLEDDFLQLVAQWGESIEAKDRYTRGHCQRVAEYACQLATRVGISGRDLVWFRMGAFLHDIGKMRIPAEILNKAGGLSPAERQLIEQHTIFGIEILSSIEFPWDIQPMVRSHHERWDGRGYPDRLQGEEIPLTARILGIADVLDALTSARSYRGPLSPQAAFQIMSADRQAFDPEIFEIFEECFDELMTSILAHAG